MESVYDESYFHSTDTSPAELHLGSLELPATSRVSKRLEDEYCRLCATRAIQHDLKTFAVPSPEADNIYTSITRLDIRICRNDGLPQVACANCLHCLKSMETFRQCVISAQSVLRAMFMPEQFNMPEPAVSNSLEDDTSSGEEIFGGGKIKRDKSKLSREKLKRFKKEKKNYGETVKQDISPPSPDPKRPVRSDDPLIRRWSEFLCCKRCGFQTRTLNELRQHSWQTHTRCIVFKCNECPSQAFTFKPFVRHMIKHEKTLEQCCEYCNETFNSEWDVILHKRHSHVDEEQLYKCNRCGCAFNTESDLQTHKDEYVIIRATTAGERRAICSVCGKQFLNFITLKTHMDSHDPSKNACTVCNKVFKNKYILSQHNEFVHSNKVNFICQLCGKGFKTGPHLRRHVNVHSENRPYRCDKCQKTFRSAAQIKLHEAVHSDSSSHSCHLCTKSYKSRAGLRDHLRSHDDKKPYSCVCCERSFLNWSNYNKHMKIMHEKNMARSTEKTVSKFCQL